MEALEVAALRAPDSDFLAPLAICLGILNVFQVGLLLLLLC